jgi:hypothetical protein
MGACQSKDVAKNVVAPPIAAPVAENKAQPVPEKPSPQLSNDISSKASEKESNAGTDVHKSNEKAQTAAKSHSDENSPEVEANENTSKEVPNKPEVSSDEPESKNSTIDESSEQQISDESTSTSSSSNVVLDIDAGAEAEGQGTKVEPKFVPTAAIAGSSPMLLPPSKPIKWQRKESTGAAPMRPDAAETAAENEDLKEESPDEVDDGSTTEPLVEQTTPDGDLEPSIEPELATHSSAPERDEALVEEQSTDGMPLVGSSDAPSSGSTFSENEIETSAPESESRPDFKGDQELAQSTSVERSAPDEVGDDAETETEPVEQSVPKSKISAIREELSKAGKLASPDTVVLHTPATFFAPVLVDHSKKYTGAVDASYENQVIVTETVIEKVTLPVFQETVVEKDRIIPGKLESSKTGDAAVVAAKNVEPVQPVSLPPPQAGSITEKRVSIDPSATPVTPSQKEKAELARPKDNLALLPAALHLKLIAEGKVSVALPNGSKMNLSLEGIRSMEPLTVSLLAAKLAPIFGPPPNDSTRRVEATQEWLIKQHQNKVI